MRRLLLAIAVGAAAAMAACSDDPMSPPGSVRVQVTTTGIDRDDAYEVRAGGQWRSAAAAETFTLDDLRPGTHEVSLTVVAANCLVTGGHIREIDVTSTATVDVAFVVNCVASSAAIEVTVETTGPDPDPDGLSVRVGNTPIRSVGLNEKIVVENLSAGDHVITLSGAATNCTITGLNPRLLRVTINGAVRDTARTTFRVTCAAFTGDLRVVVQSTGSAIDPDGYSVTMDGAPFFASVPSNGTAVAQRLVPGSHSFKLEGIAANCSLAGNNPRSVTVVANGSVDLAFNLTCVSGPGDVRVITQTTGVELDPDGYSIVLDASTIILPFPSNGTTIIPALFSGPHSFRLDGVASNCTVSGANPRTATVVATSTVDLTFVVTCVPTRGAARIIVQTSGADIDPDGYQVTMNGAPLFSLPANGEATASDIVPGAHIFELLGVAPNCTISGTNPRTLNLVAGVISQLSFTVNCLGTIRITASVQTTGPDPDRNGYVIRAHGSTPAEAAVTVNGTVSLDPVLAGTYTVRLDDLAPNCEVTGGATRTISASSGTVSVSFAVTCTTLARIAFAAEVVGAGQDIFTSKADGTDLRQLTNTPGSDAQPAWSAAAGLIAFWSARDGNAEIYVMNEDGSGQVNISNTAGDDYAPAWSPNGTQVAFVSERSGNAEIWVMDRNGANARRLTNDPARDADPAWSPDGTKIAFVRGGCDFFACFGRVHVVSPTGLGATPLGESFLDADPDWSPDGNRIAVSRVKQCGYYSYFCERDIVTMSQTGSAVTPLIAFNVDESQPAWSPTGLRLLVAINECTYYLCGVPAGIRVIQRDGSDPVLIHGGSATDPAWRR